MMQKARKQDMLQWSLIGSWREGRLEGEEGEGGSGRGREGKGEGGEGGGRGGMEHPINLCNIYIPVQR